MMEQRIIRNEEIQRVLLAIPEGHRHLRATLCLTDGTELVLQEATVANIARAYLTLKTHPTRDKIVLEGRHLPDRRDGFAEWQLLEMSDYNRLQPFPVDEKRQP